MISCIEHSLINANLHSIYLEQLTCFELKTLSATSKTMKAIVENYVLYKLDPYYYPDYESSPYCKVSHCYNAKMPIPTFVQSKRALELAITFSSPTAGLILKLYPSLLICSLELGAQASTSPLINQEEALYKLRNCHSKKFSKDRAQESVTSIITQALDGPLSSLIALLKSLPSIYEDFLYPGLFQTIESNNLDVIQLISYKINKFGKVHNMDDTPLAIATKKSLVDLKYLPQVVHFLCCGYRPETERKLVEKSVITYFGKKESIKKQIRGLFKAASYFHDFVRYCAENNNEIHICFSASEQIKEKALLKSATIDKALFNALINSLLPDDEGRLLNKNLTHQGDKKRLILALFDFAKKHPHSFNANTLERIADNLIGYAKSQEALDYIAEPELKMAVEFYHMAIGVSTGSYEGLLQKLQQLHKRLTLGPTIHKVEYCDSRFGYS